jgi:hypothetical protein
MDTRSVVEIKHSKFKRICVFCGSSPGKKTTYQDAAIQLGNELVCIYFFFHFFFSFVKFNRVWEYYENIHKNNFFFEKNETNFMMWQDILILCFYSVIYSVLVIVEALKAKVLFFSSFTITPKTLTKVFNYFYFFLFSIDWNLHFCFLLRFWFQSNICTELQMVFVEE